MTIRRFLTQALVVVCALSLPMLAGAQALVNAPSSPSAPRSVAPKTYGTAVTSYADVGEWEFTPIDSGTLYSDVQVSGTPAALKFATAGHLSFQAPLHLPSGAVLQSIELDACDSNTNHHVYGGAFHCDHVTGLCTEIGDQMNSSSSMSDPCQSYVQDVSGLAYMVDNAGDRMVLQVVTTAGDDTTSLAGMRVGYKLQVSPPPATADFADVPPSHPFFQYIEALVKSGITAGCGGGNYCPDVPLTRGQMAVFLAKALGLQFP